MGRATALRRASRARGVARHAPGRAWGLAAVGSALLGALAASVVQTAPPAQSYWTDSGTITSGAFTTWAVTGVSCSAVWGNPVSLSWTAPNGTSTTVSITASTQPSQFLGLGTYWSQPLRPGSPQTTTGTQQPGTALWGIATTNPAELSGFSGTWTLVATAPGGVWTATRTGTWTIDYLTGLTGTTSCQ